MDYKIVINKDVKDRFKIYKSDEDEPIIVGEKYGFASSFFDGVVGSSYSKGATYRFKNRDDSIYMEIERNFYDELKIYNIMVEGKKRGFIHIAKGTAGYALELFFDGKTWKSKINPLESSFRIPDIGEIVSEKRGFTVYHQVDVISEKEEYLMMAFAMGIYTWDVFIKNRTGFIGR